MYPYAVEHLRDPAGSGLQVSLPFYLEKPSVRWYKILPWVTLDLETTNLDKGDARNAGNRLVRVCVDGRILPDSALDDVFAEPCVLVAHNAKFELAWLLRYGIDLSNILPFDTQVAEYVLAGNRDWRLGLGATAERYGMPGKERVVDLLISGGVCPSEIPEQWLNERVKYDVETTAKLARLQWKALNEAGLVGTFYTRCIVTPVLAAIEAEGLTLDPSRVQEAYDAAMALRSGLAGELAEMTGGINMRSGKQKAEFLYDTLKFDELRDRNGEPKRTASGQRATDSDTLGSLKAETAIQRAFLKLQKGYAKVDAALTKNLEFFQGACEGFGAHILGQFNQTVTGTHRLSSSGKRIATRFGERGAQFQNMPREFKRLFCASDKSRVILEADYRQLEFITAGNLAHDAQVKRDVENRADVHKYTASILLRKSIEEVTSAERQNAKASTFKPLYGGQSGTPREKEYYAAFRVKYPDIDKAQHRWLAEVLETKQLRTASGLIFYWPDTRVQQSGYVTNTPSIYNYPVQSFATADIVPIGVVYLYWRLLDEGLDARIINTIHDSAILDCAQNSVAAVREILPYAMICDVDNWLRKVYDYELWIPLSGEVKVGSHWGADKARGETFEQEFEFSAADAA